MPRVATASKPQGLPGLGGSYDPAISADGRYVAFVSDAANLVSGDANLLRDVFLRDRVAATTVRVSVSWRAEEANGRSESPVISANGAFVAMETLASNLSAEDPNGTWDVDRMPVVG